MESISINLKQAEPCPEAFRRIEPLRLSLQALRKRFEAILTSEGLSLSDVEAIALEFEFPLPSDGYSNICHARMVTSFGKEIRYAVNSVGDSITVKR